MKVSELKKGMLVSPIQGHKIFKSYSGDWINVGRVKGRVRVGTQYHTEISAEDVAVYVGQKSDLGNYTISWSDRFALFEGKVYAVDPHAWRKLEPVSEE